MTTIHFVLLWLFVINLGIVFGAGLYETRISVARWLGPHGWDAAAARSDDVGRRFWGMTTTGPLTLLTLAHVYLAWSAPAPLALFWRLAAGGALLERVLTFGYFIPTMIALLDAPDSPAARARARRWARLNYVRLAVGLLTWLAALQTFALAR